MTIFKNSAETGLAAGTAVTTANSAAPDAFSVVVGTSVTYSATAWRGSLGLNLTSPANDASYIGWATTTGTTQSASVRFYFRIPTLSSANIQTFMNLRSGGGGTSFLNLRLLGNNNIDLQTDAVGSLAATTTPIVANTWYRLELQMANPSTTTGSASLRIYQGDSTTVYSSLDVSNVNLGSSAVGTLRLGRTFANNVAWTAQFDDVAFQTGANSFLGPSASPSFSTLTDTYATLDGTKWVYAGNASIVGGRLQLTTSATYQGAKSVNTKNLDVPVPVQVVQTAGPGNNTVDTTFQLSADASNNMSFTREGTLLYAQRIVAGVTTTIAQPAYNATSHAWWRFAVSGGQVLWQTSPDGITWTTLGTPWTPTFPITNLYAELTTGYYGTEPTPGVALFDNFGLPPASNVSPTANAGADQTNVEPWATVTLTGTDSDSDGTIASRAWTKGGVTLATTATHTFEATATIAGITETYTYTVTDNAGATTSDTMTVAVLPVTERAVIGGVEVPMRIRTY